MQLLTVNENGLYCKAGDFYIDPWKPVSTAVITHGHTDHMRWGMKHYICHHHTVPILKLRVGMDTSYTSVGYYEPFEIKGVNVSFHPAGHIIGSSQIRLAYQEEVWVFTGDYKLTDDGVSAPFETVECDYLITESTFGLPIYKFQEPKEVYTEINAWWKANSEEGMNTVLLAYSLGKAQNILANLDISIGEVYFHGAIDNVNKALAEVGYSFPGKRLTPDNLPSRYSNAVIIAPPSALNTSWSRKLAPNRVAICSGWMQLRGTRRRKGADKGFVLSDHCDWDQLNKAVLQSKAKLVYVTHGYETIFSKWLSCQYGIESSPLKTLYGGAEEGYNE